MAGELAPESVIKSLGKGQLAPFYLFYGPGEFQMERLLERIRTSYIPEAVREFNVELFYGGDTPPTAPGMIIQKARSLPLMAKNRLIIVRRTEEFKEELEKFLPYLKDPSESTCLLFVSAKTDFRKEFYKTIKAAGRAVKFNELRENELVPWIRRTARELGLEMDEEACGYLASLVGNNLIELYSELEKMRARFTKVEGVDQVKEMVKHSRIYTIFELVESVSKRNSVESLKVLNRFLEEEDKRSGPQGLIGMLNRQIRLLWQAKAILSKGGGQSEVGELLGKGRFKAKDLMAQAKLWSEEELEQGLHDLYQADGWLKSGSRPEPVLEKVIVSLCG